MSDLHLIEEIKNYIDKPLLQTQKFDLLIKSSAGYENNYFELDSNQHVIGLYLASSDLRNKNLDFLSQFFNLQKLSLSQNKIQNIDFIKNLKNLKIIDLGSNNIVDISPLIYLPNLININLKSNNLDNISPLEELIKLEEVDVGFNKIKEFPCLKSLKELKKLSLFKNEIIDISNIEYLKNLTEVYITQNKVIDISALKYLKKLTRLGLAYNRITDITALKELKKLIVIDLTGNRLTNLPEWILGFGLEIQWDYIEDTGIYVNENPLETPLIESIKQGNRAISNYFIKSNQEDKNEVKSSISFVINHSGDFIKNGTKIMTEIKDSKKVTVVEGNNNKLATGDINQRTKGSNEEKEDNIFKKPSFYALIFSFIYMITVLILSYNLQTKGFLGNKTFKEIVLLPVSLIVNIFKDEEK